MNKNDWFVIRDPIHGFIKLTNLEKEIINHPVFQRLRRIKQLSWTDMVYPGANHTRFEHSLGVMHLASRIYDTIWEKDKNVLIDFKIPEDVKNRMRQIVRLAALLHDLGHGPFSHSSENLFPSNDKGIPYRHEDYSINIIEKYLTNLIENDSYISNHGIKIKEITQMLGGETVNYSQLFWKNIISSQLDADRMDYLLRDSYYTGTKYGWFDLERIIETIKIAPDTESDSLQICTEKGGIHAAESLILARYSMFNQVYFHKVRRGYDLILEEALSQYLPKGIFAKPNRREIENFLQWDDWKIYNEIISRKDKDFQNAFYNREKLICHFETNSLTEFEEKHQLLGKNSNVYFDFAQKSWYNIGDKEIYIWDPLQIKTIPLSATSPLISNLKPHIQYRIYSKKRNSKKIKKILEGNI